MQVKNAGKKYVNCDFTERLVHRMKKHRFWAWAMIFCLFMVMYTGYKHK